MKNFVNVKFSQASFKLLLDCLQKKIDSCSYDINAWNKLDESLKNAVLSNIDELKKMDSEYKLHEFHPIEVAEAFRVYKDNLEASTSLNLFKNALLELFGFGG